MRAWWDGDGPTRARSPDRTGRTTEIPVGVRFRAWWKGFDAEVYYDILERQQGAPVLDEADAAPRRRL